MYDAEELMNHHSWGPKIDVHAHVWLSSFIVAFPGELLVSANLPTEYLPVIPLPATPSSVSLLPLRHRS